MNHVAFALALSLLVACADDNSAMTRHQVCERLATAACERLAACEPTVAQIGCAAREMSRCCPDGVCAEPVIATEDRLVACETSVATMSCTQLTDGDLPASCDDLTDPLPMQMPDAGTPPSDGEPQAGEGLLEVTWDLTAGGYPLQCSQFQNTTTIRITATPPGGAAITRDFTCVDMSALTTLPVGVYSIVAQARAGGTVVQQTPASTVSVTAGGSSTAFHFSVTTSLGGFCSQLATTVCSACAPADSTCVSDAIDECCRIDGTCNRAALADGQRFSQCLSAWSTNTYCTGSAPAVCQGAIAVY